ncbi:MAG: hypothetical protein ABIB61_01970 [Candidatus Shapirobacteria bacterium]
MFFTEPKDFSPSFASPKISPAWPLSFVTDKEISSFKVGVKSLSAVGVGDKAGVKEALGVVVISLIVGVGVNEGVGVEVGVSLVKIGSTS